MKQLFFYLMLLCSGFAQAQEIDGYWYGNANIANAGSTNNYLIEIIINHNKQQNKVDGIISYYFKNTFRSFKVTGAYSPATRTIQFFDIPVTYFASTSMFEVDCMMDFIGQMRVAKSGSTLNGRFKAKGNYKQTCPDITYSIALNSEANNKDSLLTALRTFKETYQLWRPAAGDTLVAAVVQQRPIVNYVVNNQFKERTKEIAQEITVESDSLQIDFYDNGEVDGDSISIFFNDKLLASNQRLSAKAIHLNVALDKTKEFNEISMFADNLGSIPPNTALMLVYDGRKRYEIRLSSTLKTSGTLRINRKKS